MGWIQVFLFSPQIVIVKIRRFYRYNRESLYENDAQNFMNNLLISDFKQQVCLLFHYFYH